MISALLSAGQVNVNLNITFAFFLVCFATALFGITHSAYLFGYVSVDVSVDKKNLLAPLFQYEPYKKWLKLKKKLNQILLKADIYSHNSHFQCHVQMSTGCI